MHRRRRAACVPFRPCAVRRRGAGAPLVTPRALARGAAGGADPMH
ncbi:hypothetical protein SB758_26170 [Burkholderia sp. SIMBA_013]|jgi:hypothetical protein|nr:hypothetical protein AK36_567 [Burkholderia vietnamiensis LMG 10929]TCT29127.1 hypothetical protein EC918_107198 [Burkholderia vietnamiensis]SCZ32077.1 hypothetical protein SAMN02787148_10963 [Burkholderia vietnamiensis]SFX86738.1 hypothetical protein SAMN02787160_10964 [Burkholderia vietnamiensis]